MRCERSHVNLVSGNAERGYLYLGSNALRPEISVTEFTRSLVVARSHFMLSRCAAFFAFVDVSPRLDSSGSKLQ